MLRLEILQTKKLNRSIGEARVAWRSVTEGTTSNKPCRRQFAHIVQRCGIAVHEFTVNVFGKSAPPMHAFAMFSSVAFALLLTAMVSTFQKR